MDSELSIAIPGVFLETGIKTQNCKSFSMRKEHQNKFGSHSNLKLITRCLTESQGKKKQRWLGKNSYEDQIQVGFSAQEPGKLFPAISDSCKFVLALSGSTKLPR